MTKLEEIVEEVYPNFEGMNEYFNKYDRQGFQTYCHSMLSGGIAMHIRNVYNLWKEDSEEHLYFKNRGIKHPDDMSAVIIGEVYDKFKSEN